MAKDVTVDFSSLNEFSSEIAIGLAGGPGPIDDMFKAFAAVYLTFVQRRFDNFSRGGGNWPPLKPETIKRRRSGAKTQGRRRSRAALAVLRQRRGGAASSPAGLVAILKDKGSLRASLAQGGPGNVIRRIPGGIEIGVEGGSRADSPLTLGALAQIHDEGLGNNPERKIFPTDLPVEFDKTIQALVTRALFELGKRAEK